MIESENLIDRANLVGARIKTELQAQAMRNDTVPIAAIRGPGAMVAFDIVKERGTHKPDADATRRVVQTALDDGSCC